MARSRISIIGMGFIGTSLGLAIRQAKPEIEVVGHDSNTEASKQALKLGAIEKSEWNLINASASADLLILATPAMAIKEVLQLVKDDLKQGVVITDTAGTKGDVLRWAAEILPEHASFVGGNPIVGPLDPENKPRADLFQGANYCIIPSVTTAPDAVQLVAGLVSLVGANPYFVDAYEHDGYAGLAEHLPFLVSAALLRMISKKGEPTQVSSEVHRMVSPTFRRATNFSSVDPQTYRDLCLTNRDNLARWALQLRDGLEELSALLQEGDPKKLEALFADAHVTRQVVSRPYADADMQAQAQAIRSTGGFGIGDMLGVRRRTPPERGKPSNGKPK